MVAGGDKGLEEKHSDLLIHITAVVFGSVTSNGDDMVYLRQDWFSFSQREREQCTDLLKNGEKNRLHNNNCQRKKTGRSILCPKTHQKGGAY